MPYLRSKKFPRDDYPELYEYKNMEPRIEAKVIRALRRHSDFDRNLVVGVRRSTVQFLTPPQKVNCFITSPPYMNALDYGRDNRLRNWLLSGNFQQNIDSRLSTAAGFRIAMSSYAKTISKHLVRGGYCVLVVGEKILRTGQFPSETLSGIIDEYAPGLKIKEVICDQIPDIRRSRRNSVGVKVETYTSL